MDPTPQLQNILNPVTSSWIYTKYQLANNTDIIEKMDLRHMCDKVVLELEEVE